MKKKSASQSAFFNLRVLIGFVLCLVGISLALVGWSKSVTEMSTATGIANPVPLINQPLVPDAVAPGGAGFTLTVNGTGFVSGSVVNWNGSVRATTFVSGSQLTAAILASDIATASTASVTVVNPSPGGGTSNVVFFPITLPTSSISLSRSDQTGSAVSGGVGDFNGDGKLDLAGNNFVINTVSILLGNGDGTFRAPVDYATGSGPGLVIVRDFNMDGNLDLAVTDFNSDAVSILLGNGDGTFQAHVDYAAGRGAGRLAAGDFNGDGNLDLVVSNATDNTVSLLLGNGDGTFRAHVDYPAGPDPSGVAIGDFNGDGKLDLVVADFGSTDVSVLLGKGDGTFQAPVEFATAGATGDFVDVADLNGDGILDLVVPNQTSSVSILLGNGDGTFRPHVDYPANSGNGQLTVADLNGDGKLDLVVTARSFADLLSILLGNGDGTFQSPVTYATGSVPIGVIDADFNGDGRLDLAVGNSGSKTVSVFLQATTVALSETSLNFGLQLVGTASSPQAVTLTNTGPLALNISSISATGDFLPRTNCGSSLPPGESCTVNVAFAPTTKGQETGALSITDNAPDSPQMVALTGTGTVVKLTPSSLGFGNQRVGTISRPKTVTLTNTGSTPLSVHGINITGTDFDDFVATSTCGSSVPANSSCDIHVRFSPSGTGTRTASMKVRHDGGGQQPVKLTGTGVSN